MRRRHCLLLLLVWSSLHLANAQDATVTQDRLQGDPSQEAYVVEESTNRFTFENDGTAVRDYLSRVRVQSDAGVQQLGLLTFTYQKANDTIDIDYVRVRKPDGSIVTTPPDDIQDMPANITREAPFYSDLREKHVPVKGLSRGDLLEYQCHWRQTKPLVPGQFWMSFLFSREEVVLKQQVEVSVPRDRPVKVKSPGLTPTISEDGQHRVYTWTRSNPERIATSKVESAQLAVRGRLPVPDVQLSSFQSWDEVARWYDGLQRERIAPGREIREKAGELTRNAPDEAARLRAIFRYVSTEVRYIGVAFGIGRYQPHSASEVLSNQYGDCKDKHTLLASLLAAAGIPAYPALINTSRVLDPDVPSPSQFDHIITAVPQGKEILWLDTTTEVAPPGYLLVPLRQKPALVVASDKASEFHTTPADPPFPTSWLFKIDAQLDDSGTLEGKVEETLRGDMEVQMRAALRSLSRAQWKDLVQQVSYSLGFAGDVSDVNVSLPEVTETPLHLTYTYKRKDYPDWKGHRLVFPAPNVLLYPPEEQGKLPSSFWLGAPGEFVFVARVQPPKGYSPDLPDNKDLVRDFIEYHSTYAKEGEALVAHYRLLVKAREVSGDGVKEYKTFAEKAHEDRDQFISLSSGHPKTVQDAVLDLRNQVWSLPDSSDAKAVKAEEEARNAIQQGSMQGAIDGFKRAVSLDPKFTRAWILLGQMYLGSMQRDAGISALRKAVDSDPQRVVSYKILALALASLNRRKEAIQTWQDLAKVAPDDHDIPTNMGALLSAENRYRDALPYLQAAVKLYPDETASLIALGTAYLQTGEGDKAMPLFEKVIQLEPGADSKNSVAYALAVANQHLDDALQYADDAVREEEDESRKVELSKIADDDLKYTLRLAAYWDTLGWVHFQMGHAKLAEGYLYAAWTILPSPVVGYHLGQVYEKEQRKQDAARIYRLVADQQAQGAEEAQATTDAHQRLGRLHLPPPAGRPQSLGAFAGAELSRERTVSLPRLVSQRASAEFLILFAPGPKVEDTKFTSGSEELRTAGKALSHARFKVAFPEKSSARLVRRGVLACYPASGCSFVLMPMDAQLRVE